MFGRIGNAIASCCTPRTPEVEREADLASLDVRTNARVFPRTPRDFPVPMQVVQADPPRVEADIYPVSFQMVDAWCMSPPAPLTAARITACAGLRAQVSRIASASALNFEERSDKLISLVGRTTPRRMSVLAHSLRVNSHPEIAGSIMLGILDSTHCAAEIKALVMRQDASPERIMGALAALDPAEQRWARPMADEIDQRWQALAHVVAYAPVLAAEFLEEAEPLPQETNIALPTAAMQDPLARRSSFE